MVCWRGEFLLHQLSYQMTRIAVGE